MIKRKLIFILNENEIQDLTVIGLKGQNDGHMLKSALKMFWAKFLINIKFSCKCDYTLAIVMHHADTNGKNKIMSC